MTWEYIAGFFDGEGTISSVGDGYRVVISQTNFLVLEEIRLFVGFGNVSQVAKRKEHWKDAWIYYVARQKQVLRFLESVEPFLIVKSQKASRTIVDLQPRVRRLEVKEKNKEKKIAEVVELRENGLSLRDIGKKVNLDWSYVGRIVKKHGGRSSIG
ncbi:MAG: LAGLIDADG family homing endonuclease [bacterium]